MRAHWLLAAVLGCGHRELPILAAPSGPAVASPIALAAATSAGPHALTFSPWDGVYVRVSGEGAQLAWARTLTRGVSVVIHDSVAQATTSSPGGVWRFQMSDENKSYPFALDPPARDGLPWRVVFDAMNVEFDQRVGQLEARLRSHLVEGASFVRLDQNKLGPAGPIDDARTRDAITVLEHGLVRMDLPDGHGACAIDALMPTLDGENKPLPSPLPAEGALGAVSYTMLKVDEGCKGRSLDAEARGVDGGVRFFLDRTGSVAGLLVIGYMYSELFVGPHVSRVDLERMGRAARDELEHQAE
jgi:hypothetical protein